MNKKYEELSLSSKMKRAWNQAFSRFCEEDFKVLDAKTSSSWDRPQQMFVSNADLKRLNPHGNVSVWIREEFRHSAGGFQSWSTKNPELTVEGVRLHGRKVVPDKTFKVRKDGTFNLDKIVEHVNKALQALQEKNQGKELLQSMYKQLDEARARQATAAPYIIAKTDIRDKPRYRLSYWFDEDQFYEALKHFGEAIKKIEEKES